MNKFISIVFVTFDLEASAQNSTILFIALWR